MAGTGTDKAALAFRRMSFVVGKAAVGFSGGGRGQQAAA
jgi:hypothetical protein